MKIGRLPKEQRDKLDAIRYQIEVLMDECRQGRRGYRSVCRVISGAYTAVRGRIEGGVIAPGIYQNIPPPL
jgi:hypothetical protein